MENGKFPLLIVGEGEGLSVENSVQRLGKFCHALVAQMGEKEKKYGQRRTGGKGQKTGVSEETEGECSGRCRGGKADKNNKFPFFISSHGVSPAL